MPNKLLKCLALAAALAIAGPANAAEKLTVLLDWYVNPNHLPLVVAKEAGYFARAGLEVELIAPSDASAPPKLVAAGQADIAVTYQPDLMLQVKEGLKLVRVGTLIETPLNCLVTLAGGRVKGLADLKGKKIGYSVASLQEIYLDAILKSVGLTAKDVTMVNVNFNLTTALLAGQVDAVIDGYRNVEVIQMAMDKHPVTAFFPEESGVPLYDELIYEVRQDMQGDRRVAAFVRAVEAATAFVTNHPDEAFAIFAKAHPDLKDEFNRASFDATLSRYARRPAALDRGRYERFAAFLKDKGLIDRVPPLDSYAIEPR